MAAPLTFQVVCPVRNGGPAFRDTLLSLADNRAGAQPGLLISDNHSTDGSPWRDVLDRLAGWQVSILQPLREMGRVEHWNWAFAQAEADIIKPMTAGDWLRPGYGAKAMELFTRHAEVSLVFCRTEVQELDKIFLEGAPVEAGLLDYPRYLELCSERLNIIGALCGVAVRRKVMRAALPFEDDYPWAADWRFYTRCLERGPAAVIAEPLSVLNRRIARYSSRPAMVLGGLRQEWRTLKEIQNRRQPGCAPAKFCHRLSLMGFQAVVRLGRVYLPAAPRQVLWKIYRSFKRQSGATS